MDSVNPENAVVRLETGEEVSGGLIIGADGVKSVVRDTAVITEEEIKPIKSSNCAYRATVPAEEMLNDPLLTSYDRRQL